MDPQMRTAQMDMDGKVERGDPEYTVGRTSNYQKNSGRLKTCGIHELYIYSLGIQRLKYMYQRKITYLICMVELPHGTWDFFSASFVDSRG